MPMPVLRTPSVMPAVLLALAAALCAAGAAAQPTQSGQVELPLEVYDQLVESTRDPRPSPRPAPARYSLGRAEVAVVVDESGPRPGARVEVRLRIRVLEDEWMLVPVLPAGTAVDRAAVGGSDVQLVSGPLGLSWSTRTPGTFDMELAYVVDVSRSAGGWSLPVPVPRAAATTLTATLPGTGLDVAVIPSAGTRAAPDGTATRVSATVPATAGVQISWRPPAPEAPAFSRALYRGELDGDATTWTGELEVELDGDEALTLPLLPSSVTLSALRLDGEDVPIRVDGDVFSTVVRGRGTHTVTVGFEVPVIRRDGPPRVDLYLPRVPVSRFDLTLPGQKEVTVTPAAHVTALERGGATVASAYVPLAGQVSIAWAEAVPEELRAEARANAGLYHAFYAEEGVLYGRVLVDYEVSRGETNALRFAAPAGVQVNRVGSPSGAVADWRLQRSPGGRGEEPQDEGDGPRTLVVFLDRQLQGRLELEISFDRSLGPPSADPAAEDAGAVVEVPLLTALDAQRQRGMAALLSSLELTLEPADGGSATRVGENQLPAFVRQALEMPVAHTFKYVEAPPRLRVRAVPPPREPGRFDARVDTLISISDVTVRGTASVEVDVKSGGIMELALGLPSGVNLLALAGPSVRDHAIEAVDGGRRVAVEFTQEMEGQFRLDVAYERLLTDGEPELEVPTVTVDGAEVAQGRIAVEALSAVEVQPSTVEQLTALDVSELPRQLVLTTTNPILMAYKYVGAETPYRLGVTVTRHEVVEVQEAAIDRADYRTLVTRDGLAVTRARFLVRNSRKQFLRVKLPPGAEVWSAFVDGRAEKPARAEGGGGELWHLIKIIHSTRGFPVEVIFQTRTGPLRGLGTVRGVLPRPEILVTESRWDVHLPAGVRYGKPGGGLDVVAAGTPVTPDELADEAADLRQGAGESLEPLRLVVPAHAAGVRFAFEKLYANQGSADPGFTIPYASGAGRALGTAAILLATLICWLGAGLLLRRRHRWGLGLLAGGGLLLAVLAGRYQVGTGSAVWLSVFVLLGASVFYGRKAWERRREPAGS